jgi:predicted ester cyclase
VVADPGQGVLTLRLRSRRRPESAAPACPSFAFSASLRVSGSGQSSYRDAPDIFGWHHAHSVLWSVKGKRIGKEQTYVRARDQGLIQPGRAISEGDLDALDDIMAPELAEEFKRDVTEIRRAFPDYAGTNVEQIAEGEKVANRFVFLGTHLGEFEGVTPTGKRIEFIGHSIDRVVEGKIVESWVEVDMLGVMQQLGAVPEPGQS